MKFIPKPSLVFALLALFLLNNCQKSPVENRIPASEADAPTNTQAVTDRGENEEGGETIISVLGPASNFGITEADFCEDGKVRVVCVQHSCNSLRNTAVGNWRFFLRYYTVDHFHQLVLVQVEINSNSATPYAWRTLNYIVIKSSVLAPYGYSNMLLAEAYETSGTTTQVATTDLYCDFDCNASDGVLTMHKLICNPSLPSFCSYTTQAPVTTSQTLVVSDNCANSSSRSESLTPVQEYIPCFREWEGGHH